MKFSGVCSPYNLADAMRWWWNVNSGEGRAFLTDEGWRLLFYHPGGAIAGKINVSNKYFKEYNLDEEFVIGLDGWRLHDMLKAFEKKEVVRIEITKEKTVIQSIPKKGKGILTYEMKNLDPEFTRSIPDLSKIEERTYSYNTIVEVPIELIRSERRGFKKEHMSYETQLFLIGYNGKEGVVFTGEVEKEKPKLISVEGKGDRGFVILSSDVFDDLLKYIPKRVKTLVLRVDWGDVAHVRFAFDPNITVDAYVAPYRLEEDEVEEWLREAGFKEVEVKPKPEKPPEPKVDINKIKAQVKDLEDKIDDALKYAEERYRLIQADVSRIYSAASKGVKPHHIDELKNVRDDVKALHDKLWEVNAALMKKTNEINKLMEEYKDSSEVVQALYPILGELTEYKLKLDKWLKKLEGDLKSLLQSIENMKKELEKAEAEAKAKKEKVELEELVKKYADEVKQIREEFNKLKEQLETLKKMNIEMIDYKKVHEAKILSRMGELEEKLKDVEKRLKDIYKKTGLVYADNLANEAEMLRKTIESYHKENVGWLLKKLEEYVREFLKSKSITSDKLFEWMLRGVLHYVEEEKREIPKHADLEKMLKQIVDINRLIYTNEYEFRKEIANRIKRDVMKSTKLTYYSYEPSQVKVQVSKEFITAESKPIYGVTYSYSFPRLTVDELKQLGIEPNPKKWVAPPLGWKEKPKPEKKLTEEEMLKYMHEHINEHYIPAVEDLIKAEKLTDKQKRLIRNLYKDFNEYVSKEEYDTLMALGFILRRLNLNRVDNDVLSRMLNRAVDYGLTNKDRSKLLTYFYRYRGQLADPKKLTTEEIRILMDKIIPYVEKFSEELPDLKLAIGWIKTGLKYATAKPEEMPYIYKSPRPLSHAAFPQFFKELDRLGVRYVISEDGFVIGTSSAIPVRLVDELELKLEKTQQTMKLEEFARYFKETEESAAKAIVEASKEDLLHDVSKAIKGTKSYNRYMVESSAEALRKEAEEYLKELEAKKAKPKPKLPYTEQEIRIKTISEISKLESIHNVTVPEDVVNEIVSQVMEKLVGVPKEKVGDVIRDVVKKKVQAYLKEIKKPPEAVTPEKVEDIIAGEMAIAAAKYDVTIPEDQRIEFTSKLIDRAIKLKTIDEVRDFVSKEINKWVSEHAEEWRAKPPTPTLEDIKKCVEKFIDTAGAAKIEEIMEACRYPEESIKEVLDYMVDHGYRKIGDYYLTMKAPSEDEILAELGSREYIRLGFVLSVASKYRIPPKAVEIIVDELIRKGRVVQEGSGASARIKAKPTKPPAKPTKPAKPLPPERRRELMLLTPVLVRYEALCKACSFNIRSGDVNMLLDALKKGLINRDKLIETTKYLLSCRILPTNAPAAKRFLSSPEFTMLASELGILDEVNRKLEEVDTVIKLKEARVSTATLNAYAKILISAIKSRTYVFDLNKLCILAQFTDLIDEKTRNELKEAIATMQPPAVKPLMKRYEALVEHECFETLKSMLGI